jgi:hypothetical protein
VNKQAMGSFVSFTFSTKFLCGVNQMLTVIAVIQIQNLRQTFMSKSRNFMSRKARYRSIRPNIMTVPGNIGKNFGFEKLTGFLNHKPDLI